MNFNYIVSNLVIASFYYKGCKVKLCCCVETFVVKCVVILQMHLFLKVSVLIKSVSPSWKLFSNL